MSNSKKNCGNCQNLARLNRRQWMCDFHDLIGITPNSKKCDYHKSKRYKRSKS